jgi:hypothetical protein
MVDRQEGMPAAARELSAVIARVLELGDQAPEGVSKLDELRKRHAQRRVGVGLGSAKRNGGS